MLEEEEEENVSSSSLSAVEKCPVYLIIYLCGFLSLSEGGKVRAVCRSWASAVQQFDLLNSYLHFYDAECINHYITPLFETIQSLAPFQIQLDTVADQCTAVVKQNIETNISSSPYTVSLLSKQKDGLRNFVLENCRLYFKTNFTKWVDTTSWGNNTWASDTGANSDVDDINDNDFDNDDDDDGFRYFGNSNNYNNYNNNNSYNNNNNNADDDDEDMGDIPRYRREEEEREIEEYEENELIDKREMARTREELGYLNLLDDSD